MQNEDQVTAVSEWDPKAVPGPGLRRRILVVDDTSDIQLLFAAFLRNIHVETRLAKNGQVAYEKAIAAQESGRPFDMILMDIGMPVLDGYDATRKLRGAGYTGTIIAHTANTRVHTRQKCLQAGCDDYMTKPFNRKELFSLVSNYLQDR